MATTASLYCLSLSLTASCLSLASSPLPASSLSLSLSLSHLLPLKPSCLSLELTKMKSMQPRRNFLRETMKPSFLSRQTLAQASLQGECASAFISNSSSFLILTDGDSQILPLSIKNRFMTTPFLSRFNFPRGMVVMVQQMATIVAFFGVLSLIFGIIAENKKDGSKDLWAGKFLKMELITSCLILFLLKMVWGMHAGTQTIGKNLRHK